MYRRSFLALAGVIYSSRLFAASGNAFQAFDNGLAAVSDIDILNAQRQREFDFRTFKQVEAQGKAYRRRSKRNISERAIDLIVRFEVSGRAVYERKLVHPIWPKGNSGVTIGVGYDIGYVNAAQFAEDWKSIIDSEAIGLLQTVANLTGGKASAALPTVKSTAVPWDAAMKQFRNFLPCVIAETEDAFPNTDKLTDNSFGALVSLVYNRGSKVSPGNARRKEMYNIHQLMVAQNFSAIPGQITAMKRIWEGDPAMKGLLERRDLESFLFEAGLTT
ncbi:glycoside hydrolase family protein [Phyllobacterium chamaecytisi]|uniref:glycoside hydrolase family protein n=1 Tax=Phyllobacterium chamaecytisi TaxID=2876082 RepID=UPI001CCC5C63|nr:hypothetical protein [Phyllobacterium sp. KW56]MBZ9603317.1 hypothetical protein [Phyllobacterium sp. KW56]